MSSMAHKSGDSGRVLGGGFEYKIPVKSWNVGLAAGGKDGVFTYDDFTPYDATKTVEALATQVAGAINGEVALTTDTNDNTAAFLAGNRTGLGSVKLVSGKQSAGAIRFKISQITAAHERDMVVGWIDGSQTIAAALPINDDGSFDAVDFFGLKMANSLASLDLVYGASLAAPTPHKVAAKVLVADTYVNLSFHCDGTHVFFFVDGEQVGDKVAFGDVVGAGVDLVPIIKVKNQTAPAAGVVVTVDSIAGANEV